jgi:DNA-binding CsgD family transcriptional regulator
VKAALAALEAREQQIMAEIRNGRSTVEVFELEELS